MYDIFILLTIHTIAIKCDVVKCSYPLPSLKFNADLFRVFTVFKIYIVYTYIYVYILQINTVIIEGYVKFFA